MSFRKQVTGSLDPSLRLGPLITAIRPREWIKNALVFGPLAFSGHATVIDDVASATAAFIAFCCVASAGYLVNDLRDVELDRGHPVKRLRPIASGRLSAPIAAAAAVGSTVLGIGIAFLIDVELTLVIAVYTLATISYSLWVKRLVILDVMTIAGLFLLRVVGGAEAIDAPPSRWLIICTAMMALFLGFAKRRQETAAESGTGPHTRPVLDHYSLPFLDQMVALSTAATLISYAIYATESPLVGDRMLITTPSVLYGIFRYLYLVYHRRDSRDSATLLRQDPGMIASVLTWVALVIVALYA